jgi:hypothetical protein
MARVQVDIYSSALQTAAPANAQRYVLGPSIVIPAGQGAVVQFPARYEGKAQGLTIVQTAGAAVAVKAELLDSDIPYPGPYTGNPAMNLFNQPATPPAPVQLFRVIEGGLSGVSASPTVIEWRDDYGRPYINIDMVGAIQVDKLYLVILPQSALGSSTWDVMLLTYREVGR